ncbi:hypothetical protein [Salmonella enterica]|nr:hypothetical protein [Salmonella enterica]
MSTVWWWIVHRAVVRAHFRDWMLRGSRLSRTSLCRGWLPIARKFVIN